METPFKPASVEALEERLLFSADAAGLLAVLVDDPDHAFVLPQNPELLDASVDQLDDEILPLPVADADTITKLVVVDSQTPDYQQVIDDVAADKSVQVLLVDSSESGLDKITKTLQELESLESIHIISHSDGFSVRMGSDWISPELLLAYQSDVAQWQDALAEGADILIYGCNLAITDEGLRLMETLNELTGADVAASDDQTGHRSLDADWDLEAKIGDVDNSALLSDEFTDEWYATLAVINVTTTADVVDGDTSSISALVNDRGADGFISLREAVIAANDTAGFDEIRLGADTYQLSIPGAGTFELVGDLDISNALTIVGEGQAQTTIQTLHGQRHFEVDNSDFFLKDLTLTGGQAPYKGGSILINSGTTNLDHVAVSTSRTTIPGGGLGGGIAVFGGTLNISHSVFTGNHATEDGGAIHIAAGGQAFIDNTVFNSNRADIDGGAIRNNGYLEVRSSLFLGNTADDDASAILNNASVLIEDSEFKGNTAVNGGATVRTLGSATIDGSLFADNVVDSSGGGILNSNGYVSLSNSTFINNEAVTLDGGAYAQEWGGTSELTNLTFHQNHAGNDGGAIYVGNGYLSVDNSTFVGNTADDNGGAMMRHLGNLDYHNSIFAQNSAINAHDDVQQGNSLGFNLFDNASPQALQLGDMENANPGLGPLQDNGGPVVTMELMDLSDAIDAGKGGARADARGVMSNEYVDIGATEYTGSLVGRKIYWTDEQGDAIYRANEDGSNTPTMWAVQKIATTTYEPQDIVVDQAGDQIIWSETDGTIGQIMIADLNGQGAVAAVSTSTHSMLLAPYGLALDPATNLLYVSADNTVPGNFNGILAYTLSGNTLTYDSILVQGKPAGTTVPMYFVSDVDVFVDPDTQDTLVAWVEQGGPIDSNTTLLPFVAAINLTVDPTLVEIYVPPPSDMDEPQSLAWNENSGHLYIADMAVNQSAYDYTYGVGNFILAIPPQSSGTTLHTSGMVHDAGTDRVWFTINDPTAAAGAIWVANQSLAAQTAVLNNVNSPKAIALGDVSAVTSPPRSISNSAMTLSEGATETLTQSHLEFQDPDTPPQDIDFSITTPLTHGHIESALNPGVPISSFTQQDINDGIISYVHDGTENFHDELLVDVSDQTYTLSATLEISILADNENAPTASVADASVAEGGSVSVLSTPAGMATSLAALTNDLDVGDELVYSVAVTPAAGTVIVNPNGTFTYTQDNSIEALQDSFVYRVTDEAGTTAEATITIDITQVNDNNPVALNDSFVVPEGQSTPLAVLSNDSDADLADTLTVTLLSGVANEPQFGSLALGPSGTIIYTHDGTENFADGFTYQISDGATTDTATVVLNITPANDNNPVAVDDTLSVAEGQGAPVAVLVNDSDDDTSDTLTVSLLSGGANEPQFGTVSLGVNNTIIYNHNNSENFADSFVYQISDGVNTDTATVVVTITPVNDNDPVAVDDTLSVTEGQSAPVAVLSNDTDQDNNTLSVTLLSGPQNEPQNGVVSLGPNNTIIYNHDNSENFSDSFNYLISDGTRTDTATVVVNVNPINDNSPVAADDTLSVNEGQGAPVAVLSNDSDADNDALTITLLSGTQNEPQNGVVSLGANNTIVYNHDGSENFTDSFTYQISDGATTDTATVMVTINPLNDNDPVAVDDTLTVIEGQGAAVSVLSNDSDVDNNLLTVSLLSGTQNEPQNGVVSLGPNNTIIYTHDSSENFTDSFNYQITDGTRTDTATVVVNINPVNDNDPVAIDDSLAVDEGQSASIAVLANDGDVDNDALILTLLTGASNEPQYGTLTLNPAGVITYSHDGTENFSDSFVYQVSDGTRTDTATVSVTVTPINDNAPQIPGDSVTVLEGGKTQAFDSGRTSLLQGVIDADPGDSLTVVSVTQPTSGSLAWNAGGFFEYSHYGLDGATDSFTYTVADDAGNSDTQTVSIAITPVNHAPAGADVTISAVEDTPYTFTSADFPFTDGAENHNLSAITLGLVPNSGQLLLNGIEVITGQSVSEPDINSGMLVYQPPGNISGSAVDGITFQVIDDGGIANGGYDTDASANLLVIDVVPVNDDPVVAATAEDIEVLENQSFSTAINASLFADADGDQLSWTVTQADGTALPAWLSFDTVNLVLNGNPTAAEIGDIDLLITVTDNLGGEPALQALKLTVIDVNDAPTDIQPGSASIDENSSGLLVSPLTVVDPDSWDSSTLAVNDNRFEIINNELHLIAGNELDFESESSIDLILTATDTGGNTHSVDFVVYVNNVNEVPTLSGNSSTIIVAAGSSATIPDNLFVDPDGDDLTISFSSPDGPALPEWVTYDPISESFSVEEGAPAGSEVVMQLFATDPDGEQVETEVTLLVEPPLAAAAPAIDPEIAPVVEPAVDTNFTLVPAEPAAPEESQEPEAPQQQLFVEEPIESDHLDQLAIPQTDSLPFQNALSPSTVAQTVKASEFTTDIAEPALEAATFESTSSFQQIEIPLAKLFEPIDLQLADTHIALTKSLDRERSALQEHTVVVERVVKTSVTVSTGISVGYIVWLLRGGVLLGSVLSSLPAWRTIDPLPVLASLDSGVEADDDESLESLVNRDKDDTDTDSESDKSNNNGDHNEPESR